MEERLGLVSRSKYPVGYLLFTAALVLFAFLYPVLVYDDWVWGFATGLAALAGCSLGFTLARRKTGRRSDLTS
jgi:fumarate reductase subunit D